MVEANSADKIQRIYSVRANAWGVPFISFTTREEAYECFLKLAHGIEGASSFDYIIETPLFRGYEAVE